jgi:hypothetical protein
LGKKFDNVNVYYYFYGMGKSVDITGMRVGRLIVKDSVRINGVIKWRCICDCGKETIVITNSLLHGRTKSCGCYSRELVKERMTGENNFGWKGGVTLNKRGYIETKHGEHRGKLQHRILYEKHYNVSLLPHQNLHHINGDKTDNRIENLELWDCSQPYGQRVEDKIKYYFKLVEDYKNHPEYSHLFQTNSPII